MHRIIGAALLAYGTSRRGIVTTDIGGRGDLDKLRDSFRALRCRVHNHDHLPGAFNAWNIRSIVWRTGALDLGQVRYALGGELLPAPPPPPVRTSKRSIIVKDKPKSI